MESLFSLFKINKCKAECSKKHSVYRFKTELEGEEKTSENHFVILPNFVHVI